MLQIYSIEILQFLQITINYFLLPTFSDVGREGSIIYIYNKIYLHYISLEMHRKFFNCNL